MISTKTIKKILAKIEQDSSCTHVAMVATALGLKYGTVFKAVEILVGMGLVRYFSHVNYLTEGDRYTVLERTVVVSPMI